MPTIVLRLPILVRHIKVDGRPYYYVRPLFLSSPAAASRRFNGAINRLQQEIKDYFKGFSLQRANLQQFLWYNFAPEFQFEHFEYDFSLGKQFTRGRVGVVSFSLQGLTFACLPGFNNYFFIPEVDAGGKIHLSGQVKQIAQQLLRRFRTNVDHFDPEDYFSEKREFATELEVSVHFDHGPFKFQPPAPSWFLSLMAETADFDGSFELEKVGTNLSALYPDGLRRAYYLDRQVDQAYRVIFQDENTPLAIVGPEGVGRHTLLHETVWRHQSDYYGPKKKKRDQLWHVDPTRIVAGMSVVGMWEKRFEAIIHHLIKPENQEGVSHKIFFDNPVALQRVGRTAQSNLTLSDVLKPYLEKRQLQVILVATPEEWKVLQERDRRFSDLFQVMRMQEPDLATAARIILEQRRQLELEHDTIIQIQAINQLLTIQRNYLKNKPLPGSILKLLQQLAVKYRSGKIDVPEVRQEFRAFSGLEERIFDPSQNLNNDELQDTIRRQLVGQPQASAALTEVVHLIKSRLADRNKPVSSFLFIGPTGVGKTQAAKVLCQYLMGSEEQLLRFDMNEFIDEEAVQRLIGTYYHPEGLLTGKVRYRPFGILLLDEIEKAHPKVHDLLLQVLDDGRLTDSMGRTVDFTNTVIIMTSNLGAREIAGRLGYRTSAADEEAIYRKAVERQFRPEFINRIDRIVIFNPLELEHILRIARLQIKELLQRDGFVRRTTILNISQEALEWVARRGFDARMGGRALRRQIERDLTTLSAEQLISTGTDNPIILDIDLREDRLSPRITELSFVAPLEEEIIPDLPDERKGAEFYRRLLQSIDQLNEHILDQEENRRSDTIVVGQRGGQELDWLYYHFKNKVAETRDQVQTTMLGFRDRFFSRAPAIPLRLKRGNALQRRPVSRGERENLRDRLFQEEALREISEAYHFASAQFDSFKSEFLNHYLDVGFLHLFARGFQKAQAEAVVLEFSSLITGMGGGEVGFLIDQYAKLFDGMDLPRQVDKTNRRITVEGYGLSDLLAGESGIHLFYVAHRNPLPVYLGLRRRDETSRSGQRDLQVIRLYDGTSTLTDLRTGYSNAVNMTVNEMKLLLFAGIDPAIRGEMPILPT